MARYELDKQDDADVSIAMANSPGTGSQPVFESETLEAVSSVRAALGALVAELPGDNRRPRELQRTLGVDYTICWQVFNVLYATDLLAAAKHTPSRSALKRFLAAGLHLGVKKLRVEAVESAIERFSRVVKTHADDQSTFKSMVAACAADEGDPAVELQQRRSSYRASSQLLGAQTESHVSANFIRQSSSGEGFDECIVSMRQGFRKLRPNASPIVFGSRPSSGSPNGLMLHQAIDVEAAKKYHAPLLPEFSTHPLPPLRTVVGGAVWTYTKLASEGIGRQSKVNLAFGVYGRNVPYAMDENGKRLARTSVTFRTPTESCVINYLVHRASFGSVEPWAMAFQNLPGDESPDIAAEAPQFQLFEKVASLGPAGILLGSPDTHVLPRMLHYTCQQMKWNLDEFDLYQFRIQYPIFGSVLRIQFRID